MMLALPPAELPAAPALPPATAGTKSAQAMKSSGTHGDAALHSAFRWVASPGFDIPSEVNNASLKPESPIPMPPPFAAAVAFESSRAEQPQAKPKIAAAEAMARIARRKVK
jgi:hypothetical protein